VCSVYCVLLFILTLRPTAAAPCFKCTLIECPQSAQILLGKVASRVPKSRLENVMERKERLMSSAFGAAADALKGVAIAAIAGVGVERVPSRK